MFNYLRNLYYNYLDGSSFKSYSSEGEDMILKKIFYRQDKGFYLDIGAFHPKKASNTYFFYKRGWSGINIDAMPGSMILFNKFRKRDINIEVPIGKDGQFVNYFEFEDKSLNGFESESLKAKDQNKSQNRLKRVHQLKCKSLNSILDDFLPPNQTIDFLSIDVEGQEFTVLESFDFDKYSPIWILAEILDFSFRSSVSNSLDMLLMANGYQVRAKTLNTVFYYRPL
ncbi:methyltransferase FkbM-like protein [Algoriphagus yeomjeoni]|uniref:Methyltransferase FkbM-like protein n=2 Tax=Algoriphagus yeomjeoni TaxID=291403 RepID=A0A327P1Y8_9BACT|nr:methyltransferase FkbM-like protein [Algoriphagus yeomjeoni]